MQPLPVRGSSWHFWVQREHPEGERSEGQGEEASGLAEGSLQTAAVSRTRSRLGQAVTGSSRRQWGKQQRQLQIHVPMGEARSCRRESIYLGWERRRCSQLWKIKLITGSKKAAGNGRQSSQGLLLTHKSIKGKSNKHVLCWCANGPTPYTSKLSESRHLPKGGGAAITVFTLQVRKSAQDANKMLSLCLRED